MLICNVVVESKATIEMPLKGQIEGETQGEKIPSFVGNFIKLVSVVLGPIKKDVVKDYFPPIRLRWSMIPS